MRPGMLGRRSTLDSPDVRMHELFDAFSADKLQVGLRLIPMHRRRHREDSHRPPLVGTRTQDFLVHSALQ
jgi:hypothetical protein